MATPLYLQGTRAYLLFLLLLVTLLLNRLLRIPLLKISYATLLQTLQI
jgi:hypothetical protein